MPRQVNDVLAFEGQTYNFVLDGGAHPGLFRPEDYSIFPVDSLEECWNGFQAEYAVRNSTLVVEHLHVKLTPDGLDKRVVGPRVHRVAPAGPVYGPFCYGDVIRFDLFDNHYWSINQRVRYTGRLLAFRGKIWFGAFIPPRGQSGLFYGDGYKVYSLFSGPWAYKQVVEISFDRGGFVTATDLSAEVSRLRELILQDHSENLGPVPDNHSVAELVAEGLDGTYGPW